MTGERYLGGRACCGQNAAAPWLRTGMYSRMRIFSITMALFLLLTTAGHAGVEDKQEETPDRADVFAVVGGTVIPIDEFEANFHAGVRQRFYHGQVPAADIAAFRREVAAAMVDRLLLLQEAERQGIAPDERWMDARMTMLTERIAASADPVAAREALRAQLMGDSVIAQLRQRIEQVPAPDREAVLAYYRAQPDKFTTPERLRVSMILLRVEPWSGGAVWEAAQEEAQRLYAKLKDGASFSDLARLHSADGSAAQGGDLGYVHKGMLAREAQEVLDAMQPGTFSAPLQMLQGYALFRLDERVVPQLNAFDLVAERAGDLLHRELSERAWQDALARLHETTAITVNEELIGVGAADSLPSE